MEILLGIAVLVIIILLFKINDNLQSIDNEMNHIYSSLVQDLNPNLITIGNNITNSVDEIGVEIQKVEEMQEVRLTEVERKKLEKQRQDSMEELAEIIRKNEA